MKLTLEKVKAVIGRFAVVFQPHTEAGLEELATVWMAVLGEFEEGEVISACKRCLGTLTRFPYPADIAEAIHGNHKTPNAEVTWTQQHARKDDDN